MMRTTVSCLKRFPRCSHLTHERRSPGPHVQMNCSNSWYAHYDVSASCTFWYYSVWSFQVVMLHWHTAWFNFLQSFTFTMKRSQLCKWCISMAMHRTQQILCFSLIINFVLQVSSLHCLASWPRNTGPCRILPCFIRPAGRQECSRGCGVQYAHANYVIW